MHVNLKFLVGCFLFCTPLWSQVQIRGLSFLNEQELQIYELTNQFTKEKKWLQTVTLDTMGIFNTELALPKISTIQICSGSKCGLLYTQPRSRYILELPEIDQRFYNEAEQDIELLFYNLDSNDINYRILGFEAWMDNYIADIYQLKDLRSEEFILRILAFKAEAAAVYGNDTNTFLQEYIKYSIGLTIDNFSVVGGPTKGDKYNFYLQTDTVDFSQPKLIEYALTFYQKFETQVDQNTYAAIESALLYTNLELLLATLVKDPYIYSPEWAEFVALDLIIAYHQNKRIDQAATLQLLKALARIGRQSGLRNAANFYWLEYSKLSNGNYWDKNYVVNELNISLKPGRYIYLHHYIPANQKCIAEMAALQRLAKRYEDKLQVVTLYPSEQTWTKADQKAFEGSNWQRVPFSKSHPIWQQLSWTSAPSYILLDPQLSVLRLDALGPLPNARAQTIDLILNQLFSN